MDLNLLVAFEALYLARSVTRAGRPPSIAIPIVKDGKNIRCEIMPNGAVLTIDDSRYSVQRLAPGSNS